MAVIFIKRLPLEKQMWAKGVWQEEPDFAVWRDKASHYLCVTRRNFFGVWCGYVGVCSGHPCWGKKAYQVTSLQAHGGVVVAGHEYYSSKLAPWMMLEPGETRCWWFGFDCGHGFDYSPNLLRRLIFIKVSDVSHAGLCAQ